MLSYSRKRDRQKHNIERKERGRKQYWPVEDPIDVVLMNFDQLIQILGSHQLIAQLQLSGGENT